MATCGTSTNLLDVGDDDVVDELENCNRQSTSHPTRCTRTVVFLSLSTCTHASSHAQIGNHHSKNTQQIDKASELSTSAAEAPNPAAAAPSEGGARRLLHAAGRWCRIHSGNHRCRRIPRRHRRMRRRNPSPPPPAS
uniref:Uncharacterized protein n=1 Tax=Oryza glumipatula TaxID=40148 RepID=A0A0D9YA00_9ORYZ